jgi:hypothetical protein
LNSFLGDQQQHATEEWRYWCFCYPGSTRVSCVPGQTLANMYFTKFFQKKNQLHRNAGSAEAYLKYCKGKDRNLSNNDKASCVSLLRNFFLIVS